MLKLILLKLWILRALFALEPNVTWKDTYLSTATAIATESLENPLFDKDPNGHRTAAVFIALGLYEGLLKQDAIGDCPEKNLNGMCKPGSVPHSVCMFQINDSNFEVLGVTKDALLSDFNVCLDAASIVIHQSFQNCRSKRLEDKLNWYVLGAPGCQPNVKGYQRMSKAIEIYTHMK